MFRFHDPRGGPLTIAFGRWPIRSEGRSTIKETDRMYLWRDGWLRSFRINPGDGRPTGLLRILLLDHGLETLGNFKMR
jgi:hypothetical protein